MTVQELIIKLSDMPLQMRVLADYNDIDEVIMDDNFYNGDAANLKCPVITVVRLK